MKHSIGQSSPQRDFVTSSQRMRIGLAAAPEAAPRIGTTSQSSHSVRERQVHNDPSAYRENPRQPFSAFLIDAVLENGEYKRAHHAEPGAEQRLLNLNRPERCGCLLLRRDKL